MKPALILAGALFTGAASLASGLLLFQRLSLTFYRQELYPYAFIAGSAIFSLLIFLLTAAGVASTWTFVPAGIAIVALSIRTGAWKRTGPALPPMPRLWAGIFIAGLVVYGAVYLAWAVAPEVSPDGSAYHLGLVARYLRQHGFGRITTNMYANISMGIEMLYLCAFSIGKHSAAAVVHFLFLMNLPLLILVFARRHNMPAAGVTAALLVFFSPVIGLDGSTAYIDVALAAVVFCCFCILQIWSQERNGVLLIPAGLLAGFAYACKLTAFVAVPYALGFVLYKLVRSRQRVMRPLLVTGVCAAAMIAPWVIKNAVIVGNPFSPFFNRWFPNPYIRISVEEDYTRMLRHYDGIDTPAQIPLEVTLRGARLQGLLGPIFLLAPIMLLAARWPLGRQLLLAAAVFAVTYPANIGTRFLIAAVPFIALAMAMVLVQWRMAAAVVVFHAFACWPAILSLYCHPYAWRIEGFRIREALRLESDDSFLRRMSPGYATSKLVDQHVPRDGRVLMYGGVAEAYVEREVLICYQAGLNNMLCEMWTAGMERNFLPARHWNFRFDEAPARKVRLVQTTRSDEIWSVSEFRVLSSSGEIPRDPKWRVKASPNPWDVQLAFDNCPVTRWKSWQRSTPGMFLELDFGETVRIAGAVAAIPGDNQGTAGRIEIETEPGRWKIVAEVPEQTPAPELPGMRRTAIEDLKRYGITHLAVANSEFIAVDVFRNQAAWGIKLVGEAGDCKLYRLD